MTSSPLAAFQRSDRAPRRGLLAAALMLWFVAACGSSTPAVEDAPAGTADQTAVAGSGANGAVTPSADGTEGGAEAEAAFLAEAEAFLDAVAVASEAVTVLLEDSDISSALWRDRTATALLDLTALLDTVHGIEEVPSHAATRAELVSAASKYSWAASTLAQGVQDVDIDAIETAAALLTNATVEMAAARDLLAS